ncbi:NB-ARC domain-containing protein [Corchorus olitorius]|uniref:NB-ARC domain-containing protein n=1 Tax=Corchorus olitorius TaxID=93759 RepID=A0A1R3K175_9ROSI|nr:NB-ARC domain-containing protein [Corchorus olitorius]
MLQDSSKLCCVPECSALSSLLRVWLFIFIKRNPKDSLFRSPIHLFFSKMEVIVAAVTDAMLSAFFHSIFQTLSSREFLKFSRQGQIEAEIKKWENLLLKLNALLEDAEEKQITSRAVKLWLRDLQDIAFDADDVVDELATEALRRKLMDHTQPSATTSKVWKFIRSTCFSAINPTTVKFDANIKSRIQQVTKRLHDLAALKNDYNLVEIGRGRPQKVLNRLPTTSLVDDCHVYGREGDKNVVLDLLMDGGELNEAAAPGSKILVTTRNKRVAAIMANYGAYHLNELSNDDCLLLFTWHALRASNFDKHPNLKLVGEQIRAKSMPQLQCLQNGVVQFPEALKCLVISNCIGVATLWQKGAISLTVERLRIKDCSQFVLLADNEKGLLSNPEDLRLFNCCTPGALPWGLHDLASLEDLHIESCVNLVSLPETGFLKRLKYLKLKNCRALKSLPRMMMHNCPLEGLEIEGCPAFTCFPSGRLPNTLRRLKVENCIGLVSLPEGLMQTNDMTRNISHLENLEIIDCPSLTSFPEGKLPTSLKILKIWNCCQLEPFYDRILHKSTSLEFIDIWNWTSMTSLPECLNSLIPLRELNLNMCPVLKYFPEMGLHLCNLRKFEIYHCISLKSLPDQMSCLTSLEYLTITECPGLVSFPKGGLPPNLLSLVIWECENFKQPLSEWNLHTLASLRELTISGVLDIVSFPDEKCLLPTTLVSIYISKLNNLRSLSLGICNLTSLEELEIAKCPKLQYLPKEGLPAKLGRLCIEDCQLLKQQCLKGKGAFWPVIGRIPFLEIETTED